MSNNTNDFAVIGGGGTGTMFLIYLAQKVQEGNISLQGQRFHLIDPKGFGSGGIAYGDCSDKELLNSVRTEMSPWNKMEFHDWCVTNGFDDLINEFNRRADYGRFLHEKYDQSIDILESAGASFQEHTCKASISRNDDGSYAIADQDTEETLLPNIPHDNITLTSGYGGPNEAFLYLTGNTGYVHNLYDEATLQSALAGHKKPKVAFIGANAALNDFAVKHPELAGRIELTSYSANGEPLGVRDTNLEENEVSQQPDFLHTVFNNAADLAFAINKELENDANPLRSRRRRALDITHSLDTVLNNQSVEIAHAFRSSSLFTKVKRDATPVPLESDEQLTDFSAQFISQRLNGNIEQKLEGGFRITNSTDSSHDVDVIINGTGHKAVPHVIQDMMDQGLVQYNFKTGTIQTTEDGTRLAGCEIPYAGPSTNAGTHGMESHAPIVEKIVDQLVTKIGGNNTSIVQPHVDMHFGTNI